MFIALGIVLSLVSLCPVILTLDGPVLPNLVPLLVALGLILVSFRIEPAEAQRLERLAWPLGLAAAILTLWILLQMLPLPTWSDLPLAWISELAHPVWKSAAAGLQQPIMGSITVDTGASAVALARVLSLIGVILLTAAVTIDRDRAETILVSLMIATALIAAIAIFAGLVGGALLAVREEALDCACLGIVLSTACAALVWDHREKRRSRHEQSDKKFALAAAACLIAFLVCAGAILSARSGSLLFAAAGGFGVFCAVTIIRRLDLGRWGATAIGATAIVIGVALVTGAAGTNSDPRLAFVKKDAASLDLTQRILADAPLFGDGAGTFQALVPIYRSTESGVDRLNAATAAAKISIEMGRPVLWISVIAVAIAALFLLRAGLRRRRDFFHPAVGASCLVTLTILAFMNVGLFGSALPVLAGVILGLALAQSQSRSAAP